MRPSAPALLLMLFAGVACDRASAPTEPPGPPPAELQFPTAASGVRYSFFDDVGRPVVVRDRAEVPEQLLEFTAVLIGDRTKAPAGQVYRLSPSESDERVSLARLADEEPLKAASIAAWDATNLGIGTWEFATVTAQLELEEAEAAPATARRARGTGPAPAPAPTLEIVSISDDESDPAETTTGEDRVEAPWGWKPVTIYYTPKCPYCQRAMKWMDQNNVPYRSRNVRHDLRARTEMTSALRRSGRTSGGVPTFVIGKDHQVMQGWNRDRFVELAKR